MPRRDPVSLRLVLVLIFAVLAMLAAMPLANWLNFQFWDLYWSTYKTPQFGGAVPRLTYDAFLDHYYPSPATLLACYFVPLPLLLIFMALRLRAVHAAAWALTLPFAVIAAMLFLDYEAPEREQLTFAILFGIVVALIGSASLALSNRLRPPRSAPEAKAGVHRHPWRAWLIVVLTGLAFLIAAPLIPYLHENLIESLQDHFDTFDWSGRHEPLLDLTDGSGMESLDAAALALGLKWFTLYLMPFLAFALALGFRMKPWMAVFTGFALGAILAGVYLLFEKRWWYYHELIMFGAVAGQVNAVIGGLGLWYYQMHVTSLPEDDLSADDCR